jgi:hypothetical protein
MANKNQHVVPHGKNWAVKGEGNYPFGGNGSFP